MGRLQISTNTRFELLNNFRVPLPTRPFRTFSVLILPLLLSLGSSLIAETYTYKSNVCEYRIVIVPNVPEEWELTKDLRFGISRVGDRFEVLSIEEERLFEASIKATSREWKVVDDELFVGTTDGWDVYSIPALDKVRTIAAPPIWSPIASKMSPGLEVPRALARGWFCRGLNYDDRVETVWTTFRAPIDNPWLEFHQLTIDSELLRNDPTSAFPFRFLAHDNELEIVDFDRVPVAGQPLSGMRFGSNWLTAAFLGTHQGNPMNYGVFIGFLNNDYLNYRFQAVPQFGFQMPSITADRQIDLTKWKYEFWPYNKPLESLISISPNLADENRDSVGPTPHGVLRAIESDDLTEYLALVKPEYERLVGRPTDAIPVPFLVTLSRPSLSDFPHIVWTELIQEQLELRFGKQTIQRRINNRNQENESITEATKKAQSESLIFARYMWMATALMVGGVISVASLYWLRIANQRASEPRGAGITPRVVIFLMGFSCSTCFAQTEWKIIEGEQRFQGFFSYACDGLIRETYIGPDEQTLVAHMDVKGEGNRIESFDLATLRKRSSMPVPESWNWSNAAFGTRYACSLNSRRLTVIDLDQGAIVGNILVDRPGDIQILFDKALLIDSGELIAIPSLKKVVQHPTIQAVRSGPISIHRVKPQIWRRDSDTWVVNGLQFGRDLKTKGLYLGRYFETSPNALDFTLRLNIEKEPVFSLCAVIDSDLVRIVPTDETANFSSEVVNLRVCSTGFIGKSSNHLLLLTASDDARRLGPCGEWRDFDFMSPPIIASDGQQVSLCRSYA